MIYNEFPNTGLTVSRLGIGTMRLPTLPTEDHPIDEEAAIRMLRAGIDQGVNYVDTAYGYHGGKSEVLVGKALKDGYRERVTLTTKLPVWLVEKYEDMERILDEQLTRLQTDHVDIYLLHSLHRESYEKVKALGYPRFLQDMQKKGKIRKVGFSFHDESDVFEMIARDYPWNCAQVQMNVLDEFHQATLKKSVDLANELGFGLIVMEPLRGGALARNVPEEVLKLYDAQPVKRSPVEWAFRYLYDKPEMITILSGMSDMDQMLDNIRIFADAVPNCMSEQEKQMLTRVREIYESRVRVGCTGCEYCMPCPAGVAIPRIFRSLDECAMFGNEFKPRYQKMIEKEVDAGRCVKCGRCAALCPQHFAIPDLLEQIHQEFK